MQRTCAITCLWDATFYLQKKNKSVKASDTEGVEAFLEEHRDVVKCIGEVGLDFTQHYKITSDDIVVQKEVLAKHIIWAKQFGLPMTVHSRAATGDTIDFLVQNNADRVALHAFNGNLEEALRGLKAGFFFSIPPSFTAGDHYDFRYSTVQGGLSKASWLVKMRKWKKRFLIEAIPMEKLLLETDSPVLGPVRGERNEPANLKLSAEFIAEVRARRLAWSEVQFLRPTQTLHFSIEPQLRLALQPS
ncbi:hydrolase, TatD family [Ancylostoma duodenale]|uniref:Hydrolase, TatD family n=1 Tax=Ancylostoma duodenale TaxID=51022 RepID=A0A0C2GVC0_9BILA|nr:hydrolase, TatD family [Ancylostoma duodenale]